MLVLVGGVAGCTSTAGRGTAAPSTQGASLSVSSEPVELPTAVPTYRQYPVPSSVADNPAKHRQVHIDTCRATTTGATAAGVVRNGTAQRASYAITVYFTSATATALDYATTTVTVPAHGQATFTAQQHFDAPTGVLCVLVGVS